MAHHRFLLFRIPFLALRIILDFYSLHDIIQLSLCSKRSLRVAKKCWSKKRLVTAELSVGSCPTLVLYYNKDLSYCFYISREEDYRGEQTEKIRFGDAVVPSVHGTTAIETYWENKIFGIGQVVKYIKEMFDVPITSIDLYEEEHPNEYIRIMDCIMSLQESVQDCTLRKKGRIDECLTHLLDNCKITGDLRIFGVLGKPFKNDWNIHLNELLISYGRCFTFQNLKNIDCRFLELSRSNLTSEEANQFLKHWQNGGNDRLKFISIRIKSIDQGTITSGIDTVPRRLSRYYEDKDNYKHFKFDGLDIRRNDGATGSIFFDGKKFEFGVDLTEYTE